MRHLVLPVLALASTLVSGCIVVDADDDRCYDCGTHTVVNYAPELIDGEAGCFYDDYEIDDIWYFEAVVDDRDGLGDVTAVWADVYDEYNGELIESFELYPTEYGDVWYSDWLGRTTWLDCFYPDYTVDLVVYDSYEDTDWITVVPYTY